MSQLSDAQKAMVELFQRHVQAELDGDLDTTMIDWMLPGVKPTGKPVEAAFVVVVGVKDGKVSHEHIYWDQASVLVQIGLLDPKDLPVVGAEGARKILNPQLPGRTL